jgi:uncharacterized repeat protein (TIGR02543 family)
MTQTPFKIFSEVWKRTLATVATATLALVSVLGIPASANASEMAPIIEFDGNVLASSVVHSEIGERPVQFLVGLNPAPLSRVMTTNRAGYSFGGWSYNPGGPAVATLETATHTTTRMWLYAVWNTKVNLDANGGTRASDTASTVDYRFNSTLTLPTTSTLRKKGFTFAGWTATPNSGVFATTYRAAADAVGNPTFYAAWKKTISFKAGRATGTVPATITYLEGADRVALPTAAQISLTRAGFEFVGWSTKANGKVVKNPSSYLPKKANITLHAVWKRTR